MNSADAKALARIRRRDMPLRAGRGGGFHRDKSKYNRKTKHKGRSHD